MSSSHFPVAWLPRSRLLFAVKVFLPARPPLSLLHFRASVFLFSFSRLGPLSWCRLDRGVLRSSSLPRRLKLQGCTPFPVFTFIALFLTDSADLSPCDVPSVGSPCMYDVVQFVLICRISRQALFHPPSIWGMFLDLRRWRLVPIGVVSFPV